MENRFLKFAAEILNVDPNDISMDTAYGDIPEWDSLAYLALVGGVYEEFGVDIPISECENILTLGDFYRYVDKNRQ